jgi:predicted nucleic acid-binding protein
MICLPDVNLWIGLTSNRHIHHAQAKAWLESMEGARIAFCRITELGLLRLLTNQHVMGEEVLAPRPA